MKRMVTADLTEKLGRHVEAALRMRRTISQMLTISTLSLSWITVRISLYQVLRALHHNVTSFRFAA
ncbi:Hypothetical protein PHPALM_36796 [Phytophthora palmivora]|uniref:Uncharacterized protein n=1 Tax=Phytophthora palmivora TaxID=4796 RepID=A0A2P4WZ26_9STRA|nr:Hypothetical protein PHPALM_36796 [Phytophthora palmivora]